ncbi:MAG: endonuclease/exonuclease/phosphatase family protein [bacterium]|nr:endonuclease/exonuclease/phosphatase family protein [bacterium]
MRAQPRRLLPLLALAAALALPSAAALAADQAVRGMTFAVTDPKPGEPAKRKLTFVAKEVGGGHTVVGDPRVPTNAAGATLRIDVAGATPGSQTFVLPQRDTAAGKPLWRTLKPGGFLYSDARGEFGPVTLLRLRRAVNGTVQIKGTLKGDGLTVTPPADGTAATVTLTFGTGDRYCVQYADGAVRNDAARAFRVKKPATKGCPATVTGEFLALAYNVAGLPQGLSGSDPEINTPLIGPLLNNYEITLLQETWKTPDPNPLAPLRVYHEILEATARHPFRSIAAPQPLGTNPFRPSAILADGLNRFSNFPFDEEIRIPWATCVESAADCLATKGFSIARTTFAPGVVVDVYNLHMEAGSDPADNVARNQGITQLVTAMNGYSAGRPVIIGGDFNLHTNTQPAGSQYARLLSEAGLTDVCAAVGCPSPSRIDKFAFRSGGKVTLTALSHRFETDVFVRNGNIRLSDHDALAVRFAWSVTAD